MLDYLSLLFDSSGFPARWRCGTWSPEQGWLHILSDLGVWSAYMAIPLVLVFFVARKKALPFRRIFQLFMAFILACGTTHLMEAVIFWWPAYRLAGMLKLVTAIISWVTVISLIRVLPRMIAMPTPEELEREVVARKAAEADLVIANLELKDRIRERTEANAALYAERERFRTTLESIGDAVIATDTLGRVTFLNDVAERQTGWSTDAAIGQPLQTVFQIFHETERTPVVNPVMEALRDGVVVGLANHTVLLGRDGNEHPIDDCAAPIRDSSGGVAGAVLVFRDVTQQRRAEATQSEHARLTTLRAEIAMALAATQSKASALQACCEAITQHLAVAMARIWTIQDESDTLELRASAGQYRVKDSDGLQDRILIGQHTIGQIAATGTPHHTNSVLEDTTITDQAWAVQEGMVAFAGFPLVVEGRVVGVMALFARHSLTSSVLSDLARLADNIAQYIDRRRAEDKIRESEERYRLFFESSPLPMWVYDKCTLKFLEVNSAAVEKYGYTREQFLSRTIMDIRPDDEVPTLLALMATEEGPDNMTVWSHRLRDGRVIRVRLVTHNLMYRGQPARLVQAQDVTWQIQAEEELRASEERFRQAFDYSGIGMAMLAPNRQFLKVNNALLTILGYSEQELLKTDCVEVTHPDDREADNLWHEPMLEGHLANHSLEKRYVRRDGTTVWAQLTVSLVRDSSGTPAYFVAQFQDVTDRRAAQVALESSEQRYRFLIGALAEGVVFQSADSAIQTFNAKAMRILGLSADQLAGRTSLDPIWRTIHEDGSPFPGEEHPAMVALRTGASCENIVMGVYKPDDSLSWISINAEPLIRPGETTPYGVVCSFSDITARKQSDDALAASNRLYQLLADHGRDVVMLAFADGVIEYVSPSCVRATGYSPAEIIANKFWFLVASDDRPVVEAGWKNALGGQSVMIEWRCCHLNGQQIWMETLLTPITASGEVARIVSCSRDVSRRKSLESQMRQGQKLEAIGLLAGGVAHDFNNLLTVVNGCGELLLEDLPQNDRNRALVEDIVRAGERGAALTRQLLAFGRQQMLRAEIFELNKIIPETAKLLARLLGEDITLRVDLDPHAGCVKTDVGQLEQLVINLAVNARDAMPKGGTLTVSTGTLEVTDSHVLPSPDASPGRYVRLTVKDTGTGMTPEVLARLFEPFFTTKPPGQGTGLGLATVYGIVRQSGGFVTVQSELGKGTTFTVHLPRFDEDSEALKAILQAKTKPSRRELVLVVEDEDAVRTLTTNILLRQGYRVEAAATGVAALAICDRLATPPDVVLTDVVMPGMSGRELAETLTTRYPRLKVVFLSGYTADTVLRHGVEESRVAFLQKPYTPDTLTRFLRQVLDEIAQG